VSCWVRSPHFRAGLVSGDVWLGLGNLDVLVLDLVLVRIRTFCWAGGSSRRRGASSARNDSRMSTTSAGRRKPSGATRNLVVGPVGETKTRPITGALIGPALSTTYPVAWLLTCLAGRLSTPVCSTVRSWQATCPQPGWHEACCAVKLILCLILCLTACSSPTVQVSRSLASAKRLPPMCGEVLSH
jgi:hypothetical protein